MKSNRLEYLEEKTMSREPRNQLVQNSTAGGRRITSPFLLVLSIFILIIATIAIYSNYIALTALTALGSTIPATTIISSLISIIELVVGIVGAANWRNPRNMDVCKRWGTTWLMAIGINAITWFATVGESMSDEFLAGFVVGILLSTIPAILYLSTAARFKKYEYQAVHEQIKRYVNSGDQNQKNNNPENNIFED